MIRLKPKPLLLFCWMCTSSFVAAISGQTVTIENDVVRVRIASKGAELQSILHQPSGREVFWQGDPAFWSERSPFMFPVNVRFKDEMFRWHQKEYSMPRMGLAVQAQFALIGDTTPTQATFRLESSETTLEHYPFPFQLDYCYRLEGNRLVNEMTVRNTGSEFMYFAIGGHPGFACPMEGGLTRGDYEIVFSRKLNVPRREIIESLVQDRLIQFLQDEDRLPLDDERIPNSGMFLEHVAAREIGVARKGQSPFVTVDLGDFPNVNIWTPPGMPFVCIEPMVSHHDMENSPPEIEAKQHLIALPPGSVRSWSYTIIVHGK